MASNSLSQSGPSRSAAADELAKLLNVAPQKDEGGEGPPLGTASSKPNRGLKDLAPSRTASARHRKENNSFLASYRDTTSNQKEYDDNAPVGTQELVPLGDSEPVNMEAWKHIQEIFREQPDSVQIEINAHAKYINYAKSVAQLSSNSYHRRVKNGREQLDRGGYIIMMVGYGKKAMLNHHYFGPFYERNKQFVDGLDEGPKVKLISIKRQRKTITHPTITNEMQPRQTITSMAVGNDLQLATSPQQQLTKTVAPTAKDVDLQPTIPKEGPDRAATPMAVDDDLQHTLAGLEPQAEETATFDNSGLRTTMSKEVALSRCDKSSLKAARPQAQICASQDTSFYVGTELHKPHRRIGATVKHEDDGSELINNKLYEKEGRGTSDIDGVDHAVKQEPMDNLERFNSTYDQIADNDTARFQNAAVHKPDQTVAATNLHEEWSATITLDNVFRGRFDSFVENDLGGIAHHQVDVHLGTHFDNAVRRAAADAVAKVLDDMNAQLPSRAARVAEEHIWDMFARPQLGGGQRDIARRGGKQRDSAPSNIHRFVRRDC